MKLRIAMLVLSFCFISNLYSSGHKAQLVLIDLGTLDATSVGDPLGHGRPTINRTETGRSFDHQHDFPVDGDFKAGQEEIEVAAAGVATVGVRAKACALAITGFKWVSKNPGFAAVICLTVAGASEWFAERCYRDSKEQPKTKMVRAAGKQRGFLARNWDGLCGLNKVSQVALGTAAGFASRAAWVAVKRGF